MIDSNLRILIVDDEKAIRRFLNTSLAAHGYTVFEATTGKEALQQIAHQRPDLVILDLGLPDIEGIAVLKRMREWSKTPVIILSVRDQETTKVEALDAGANDYLTKPFGVSELMARIRVAMRHITTPEEGPVLTVDQLVVDLARRVVTILGEQVQLTPTEYDLLRVMVTHAGRVLTHQQLLRQVWGMGYENEVHLLRVNISNLRHKIEPNPTRPRYILTEPGVGYRLWTEDL